MNEIKFSLIIPHHDIPDLLVRCLKSIPVRDDLQIIVVDDASLPENVERLKVIEKTFPYVNFIYSLPGKGGGLFVILVLLRRKVIMCFLRMQMISLRLVLIKF